MLTRPTQIQTSLPKQIALEDSRPERTHPIRVKETAQQTGSAIHKTRELRGSVVLGETGINCEINSLVTATQQTEAFLKEADRQLQDLKNNLADVLSQVGKEGAKSDLSFSIKSRVEQGIANFKTHWASRYQATRGMLDTQLNFLAEGSSRKSFSIKGLDTQSSSLPEVLIFHSLAIKAARSVFLKEALSHVVTLFRLNEALSPFGIRAEWRSDQLLFSVSEEKWPSVRDHLMIKLGEGPLAKAEIIATEEVIEPASWETIFAEFQATGKAVPVNSGAVPAGHGANTEIDGQRRLEDNRTQGDHAAQRLKGDEHSSIEALRQVLQHVIRAQREVEETLKVVKTTLAQIGARLTEVLDRQDPMTGTARFLSSLHSRTGYNKIAMLTQAFYKATRQRILALFSIISP